MRPARREAVLPSWICPHRFAPRLATNGLSAAVYRGSKAGSSHIPTGLVLTAIRPVAIDGSRKIGRSRIERGLWGYHGGSEIVVALEALAFGAKGEPAAAFPPRRSKSAALAEPQPGQE